MNSLKEIYRIGYGPSSSHTMGPSKAAEIFLSHNTGVNHFKVVLYGSLAATGKGHLTDVAIDSIFTKADKTIDIEWQPKKFLPFHPNAMTFSAFDDQGIEVDEWTAYSVGGGALKETEPKYLNDTSSDIYGLSTIDEIMAHCDKYGMNFWEYVKECEQPDIWDYLQQVWQAMKESIVRGLSAEEVLPGVLHLKRKAAKFKGSYLCLYSCRGRGKCLGWHHSDRSDMWLVWRDARSALSSATKTQVQRHTHSPRPCHSRIVRQRGEDQRIHIRGRGGLSG